MIIKFNTYLDENHSKNYNIIYIKDITNKNNGNYDLSASDLNELLVGKCISIEIKNNKGNYVSYPSWKLPLFVTKVSSKKDYDIIIIHVTDKDIEWINVDDDCKIIIIPENRIFSDEDPYGEEDWGYEKLDEAYINKNGELMDFSFKINYPYKKIGVFVKWFNQEYKGYPEKQGWSIFSADTEIPNVKYISDGPRGGYWQIQKLDFPGKGEALIGNLENDHVADDMARKVGLMVDEYGVVHGYRGKSFLDEDIQESSINEKFGYPDVISPVKDYLTNFVIDKFNWWLKRKGLANYQEYFVIDTDDIDPNIKNDKDFPLSLIRFKLNIVREKNISAVTGGTPPYKIKRQIDTESYYNKIYRGKIYASLILKIHTGFRTIEVERIKEKIETNLIHELQHIYSGFKKFSKGIPPKQNVKGSIFSNVLINLVSRYWNANTFGEFIEAYYPFTSKTEMDAFISEFSSKNIKHIKEITGHNNTMNYIKMDFNEIISKIEKEFKKYYPNVNLDEIPKKLVREVILAWEYFRIEPQDWIKNYNKDFRGFIKVLHDDMRRKSKRFIIRKNKAFYSNKNKKGN
jgi:hypothetical protein